MDYDPPKTAAICSLHFDRQTSYSFYGPSRKRLHRNAIPTIFKMYPKCLQEEIKQKFSNLTFDVPKKHKVQQVYTEEELLEMNVKRIKLEHDYTDRKSMSDKLDDEKKKSAALRKELKAATEKLKRREKKVDKLKDVISHLKEADLLTTDDSEEMERTLGEAAASQLISRYEKNCKSGVASNQSYPDALKAFSSTLLFYSRKAYEYVRETLKLALPSLSTIRNWYSSIDAGPGFTTESFEILKQRVKTAKENGREVNVCLSLDEMHIKKHIQGKISLILLLAYPKLTFPPTPNICPIRATLGNKSSL